MWTGRFWKDAFERAIKTFAQATAAVLSADGILGILSVSWGDVFSIAGLASVISLMTSIGSAPIGGEGTASLVDLRK